MVSNTRRLCWALSNQTFKAGSDLQAAAMARIRARGDVGVFGPTVDVGRVIDGRRHHLGMRLGHFLGHGPADAAQCFGWARWRDSNRGYPLDIFGGDPPAGPARIDGAEIDTLLARQRPDRGRRHDPRAFRRRRRLRFIDPRLFAGHHPDHGSGIVRGRFA